MDELLKDNYFLKFYTNLIVKYNKDIIYQRDNSKCIVCNGIKRLNIAHRYLFKEELLKSKVTLDEYIRPENVFLLCGKCHKKYDGGKISIINFRDELLNIIINYNPKATILNSSIRKKIKTVIRGKIIKEKIDKYKKHINHYFIPDKDKCIKIYKLEEEIKKLKTQIENEKQNYKHRLKVVKKANDYLDGKIDFDDFAETLGVCEKNLSFMGLISDMKRENSKERLKI